MFKDTKQMFRYKSVEGVFQVKTGSYDLNYDNAKRLCALQGAPLATYSQLHKAWQAGAEMCSQVKVYLFLPLSLHLCNGPFVSNA